ncbi:MAG: hypothetical protein JXL80_17905 [Planctomycetes bacterium]|nr:hypothetical protein [Planctomycetota bacterium]
MTPIPLEQSSTQGAIPAPPQINDETGWVMTGHPAPREGEPDRPKGEIMPILPCQNLNLLRVAGDAERFAQSFRQVWFELPSEIRRRFQRHWRQTRPKPKAQGAAPLWPRIELLDVQNGFRLGKFGDNVAYAGSSGALFVFRADRMDELPPSAVEAVIAHELAHGILFADHYEDHMRMDTCQECGIPEAEHEAFRLAERWGFSYQALLDGIAEVERNRSATADPAPGTPAS